MLQLYCLRQVLEILDFSLLPVRLLCIYSCITYASVFYLHSSYTRKALGSEGWEKGTYPRAGYGYLGNEIDKGFAQMGQDVRSEACDNSRIIYVHTSADTAS